MMSMQKFICVQCAKSLFRGMGGEEHDGSSVQDCSACNAKTNVGIWVEQSTHEDRVRDLAKELGYGRIMQLCEQLWRQDLADLDVGGELTVGPAAKFLVPCSCGVDEDCDWCCGAGRVTKLVRAVVDSEPLPLLLWCPGCGERHVDGENMKPHKTHACQSCGMNWRPANVSTHGVQFLPGCKD